MSVLVHGTTLNRATRILVTGPDPDFVEPGGSTRAGGFSMYLEAGPFHFGTPEDNARHKSALFPMERGPAMLRVDVPDDIIALAEDLLFPLSQGLIQFDRGAGLEDLVSAWPILTKEIIIVGAS